jgi:hypothetical protein
MARNWREYNRKLVKRGEFYLTMDFIEHWNEELEKINMNKRGSPFAFPQSFIAYTALMKTVFSVPYRQLEGILEKLSQYIEGLTSADYTTLWRRIRATEIEIALQENRNGPDVIVAIDSTGMKVTNRGEWMREKWTVILSTANREITYVECSESIGVMHGAEKVHQCILQDATYLVNELTISKENLTHIVSVTRSLVALIGGKTTCEFIMVDDTPYLITAQRTSSKRVAFPAYPVHNSGLISIGPVEGTAKWVDKASLSETVIALSKKNEKYVFLAKKPCSEFIDLLPFAKGFLFKDGSMLCHLATLLREREIPARILHDGILRYKDDDTLALK